jgi:glutamate/tyrosine decarboxylase-like PLP-dependent enzyme
MTTTDLHPCFLGPYGENDQLLERLVTEFLRDHVYWRRNVHPEDPPAIPTHAAQQPAYQAFEARLRRELHRLSAALKRSVPFHSPRYLGHMVSDLLIPGLAAQILTLPYNPNNISEEAAPITLDLELEAGLQLARMVGYPSDPEQPDCAFGHLTSGGTLANFQALRLALSMKAFPVALLDAGALELLDGRDAHTLWNLSPAGQRQLYLDCQRWLAAESAETRARWSRRIEAARLEQLGLVGFFERHPELRPPKVLAALTAHYSWAKGVKNLGLGRQALLRVPERDMRLDADALAEQLAQLHRAGDSVLMVVGILGSTEFGTIDPIDRLVELREHYGERGTGFAVHVDAAWGGYLATLFRDPDGSLRPLDAVRSEFEHFPSAPVHAAFGALAATDSITIDPHKLGYIAYGAGAFVARDHRCMELLAEQADYVFAASGGSSFHDRMRAIGRYVPEGSKAGAMAAAVCITHRVMPLDHLNFGRLPAQTLLATDAFRRALAGFAERNHALLRVLMPFEPDSNLVCLALNPHDNRSVAGMNVFVRRLYDRLRVDPGKPISSREFYGSVTTLRPALLGPAESERLFQALDLDPATLGADGEPDDRLLILRHTLMNPFLLDELNGIDYLQRYFAHLEGLVRELLRLAGEATG